MMGPWMQFLREISILNHRYQSISQINSPCFYPFLPWFSGCPNHTLIKKNTVSFRGFAPCLPTRGFAPGPHWGQSPQTPYRQNKITVDYAIFILGQIKAWAQATRTPEVVSGLQNAQNRLAAVAKEGPGQGSSSVVKVSQQVVISLTPDSRVQNAPKLTYEHLHFHRRRDAWISRFSYVKTVKLSNSTVAVMKPNPWWC